MGYHFDRHIMPHSKHALLYFRGYFSDLLRCSKVQQLKVAIVTLRSDQQGDIYIYLKLDPLRDASAMAKGGSEAACYLREWPGSTMMVPRDDF